MWLRKFFLDIQWKSESPVNIFSINKESSRIMFSSKERKNFIERENSFFASMVSKFWVEYIDKHNWLFIIALYSKSTFLIPILYKIHILNLFSFHLQKAKEKISLLQSPNISIPSFTKELPASLQIQKLYSFFLQINIK